MPNCTNVITNVSAKSPMDITAAVFTSSNWIVKIGGKLIVNELIGTGWGQTHIEGTYTTTGGVVEITNSTGVAGSFT